MSLVIEIAVFLVVAERFPVEVHDPGSVVNPASGSVVKHLGPGSVVEGNVGGAW